MPLYEYRCKKCGRHFEKIQSFSAPDVKACPVCGGKVERLISAPAFRFKGSGFYETDYAHKGNSAAVAGHGDAAPTESKPAAPATTSTPAATATAKSE